jgi:hypothetical protein
MAIQTRAEEVLRSCNFVGIPIEDFERGGREQFVYLLRAGLTPASKVVDVGCGVLRAGYWLVRFLDAGCYCGIEPHPERLEIGKRHFLGPALLGLKRPRFHCNPDFDTSVFGEKFDFFLAYSIWTHASKSQIRDMLDSFVCNSTEAASFLATFLPSNILHPDYQGDKWFGTSHESDVPGCIRHSFRWIKTECSQRGLAVSKLSRDRTHGQTWLKIARESTAPRRLSWFGRALNAARRVRQEIGRSGSH